jgi:hypothetical protein
VLDDSLIYALHIQATLDCPHFISCTAQAINLGTFSGYDHLTYRLLIGSTAKIFNWDVFTAYQYGFYIGTVLLALALLFFCIKLEPDRPALAAYALFLFTLFNGAGAFHGFYWVVPSFFAFLFFIFLASLVTSDTKPTRWWLLTLITLLGLFSHILFLYSLIILAFYFVFYSFFSNTFSYLLLKKISFVILLAMCIYFPLEHYYKQQYNHSPYNPIEVASNILQKDAAQFSMSSRNNPHSQLSNLSSLLVGWDKINNNYFRWVFHNFFSYILFCLCFSLLLSYRQYKLLGLYFGSLLLTLFASLSIHGERSLMFLWPFTFLYFGYGAWFFWVFVQEKFRPGLWRNITKCLVLIVFLFFTFITLFYSLIWNQYLNRSGSFTIEPPLTEYLIGLPKKELVLYSDKAYFIDVLLTLTHGGSRPMRAYELDQATYYVTVNQQTVQQDLEEQMSLFDELFRIINPVLVQAQRTKNPNSSYQELPVDHNITFTLERNFGDISIYRVSSEQ